MTPASELKSTDARHADGLEATLDGALLAFDAHRVSSDERLRAVEERLSDEAAADATTERKLALLDRALDDQRRRLDGLTLKALRPPLAGSDARAAPDEPEKAAFHRYLRRGDAGSLGREEKALSAGSGPDGGFLVPPEIETAILDRLSAVSPIRAIADVRRVSSGVLSRPVAISGPVVGWVGETAPRPETATPVFAEESYPVMELYTMPAATQTLLDDAVVDLDRWLTAEIDAAFAEQETAAFVAGNGVTRPKGFLAYPRVAESAWDWGSIGTVATGAAGAFASGAGASDALVDLVYALKAGFRQNAHFVMNRKTEATVRKLKDADGNYLWAAPSAPSARATLMGFPVVEVEAMPDIAADAPAIAFGDFRRGYLVVDRTGVRVIRDPYTRKPYVLFYTTKRVGGGVKDFDAIKLLRFGV